MTTTVWNGLADVQMERHDIDAAQADEILEWYSDVMVHGLFETDKPTVDVAVFLTTEHVDDVEMPVIRGTIYSNGRKTKEIVNNYDVCIDAKRMVESGQMDNVVQEVPDGASEENNNS